MNFMKAYCWIVPMLAVALSSTCRSETNTVPLPPKDYAALHLTAADPKNPAWADTMRTLAKVGDGFTLEHLKPLEKQLQEPGQRELLKTALDATRGRAAAEDDRTFAQHLQVRLERAAWVDLMCNPLEGSLVPWTRSCIRKRLDSTHVVAELQRIQTNYVATVEAKTIFSHIQQRVPSYATGLLDERLKSKR